MITPPKDQLRQKKLQALDRLLTILDELRLNCPWDKKQTISSLRHLTIEETFELSDAILSNEYTDIKKELGDLILHIIFYAKIAEEQKEFTLVDVITSLCEKLIYRHPHIYSDIKVENEEEVKQNWEKLKLKEKGKQSVLGGVPRSLPAIIKALRIQEKAKGIGFDWKKTDEVWEKVEEELHEIKREQNNSDSEKLEGELGDLLFSIINYARHMNINPEEALEKTNKKFIQRFQYIEKKAQETGRNISEMSLEEMDAYWEESKKNKIS